MTDRELAMHLINGYKAKGLKVPSKLSKFNKKHTPIKKKALNLRRDELMERHNHCLDIFYKRTIG